MHGCQAAGTRAAQQPKQKRFGLIVARVTERDRVRVEVQARALEEGMPRAMRCILDGPPLASGEISYVVPVDEQWLIEGRRHLCAEPLIARSGRPQLMVEMREADEANLAGQVELAQQVRERDRVGPARQRDDHASIAPRKVMSPDRLPDAIEHLHNFRLEGLERRDGLEGDEVQDSRLIKRREPFFPSALPASPAHPAPPAQIWCRRADSNRRPRAYETRALNQLSYSGRNL